MPGSRSGSLGAALERSASGEENAMRVMACLNPMLGEMLEEMFEPMLETKV